MSTPPNLGAINAMGGQFTSNVFEGVAKSSAKSSRKLRAQANRQSASNSAPRFHNAAPTPQPTAAMGQQMAAGRAARQARAQAGPTPPPTANTSPTPHASGVPAPRTNPVAPGAVAAGRQARQARAQAARTQPNAVPFSSAPSQAPQHLTQAPTGTRTAAPASHPAPAAAPINRTAFNQPSTNPFQVNQVNQTPAATPAPLPKPPVANPFQAPTGRVAPSPIIPTAPSNPARVNTINNPKPAVQHANVTPQSNAPFPTHVHPAGSSNQVLPNLTAAHSQPGKPNQFTVGSRNIKGGGIAAMGSQLEAGLSARPLTNPEKKRRV